MKRTYFIILTVLLVTLSILGILAIAEGVVKKQSEDNIRMPPQSQADYDFNQGLLWNAGFLRQMNDQFICWEEQLDTIKGNNGFPRYMFKPNQKFRIDYGGLNGLRFARKGDKVVFSTNDMGFRGPNFNLHKKNNEFRIICLGASTTEGVMLADWQTYPYLLEKELRKKYPSLTITVINAGHGGTVIEDQLAIMAIKGYNLDPDLVIYYGGHNNVCSQVQLNNMDCFFYKRECWKKFNDTIPKNFWHKIHILNKILNKQAETVPFVEHEIDWNSYEASIETFLYSLDSLNRRLKTEHSDLLVCSFIAFYCQKLKDKKEFYDFFLDDWFPVTIDEMQLVYKKFNGEVANFCNRENISYADIASKYRLKSDFFFPDAIHFFEQGNEELVKRMLPSVMVKIDSFVNKQTEQIISGRQGKAEISN